MSAAWCSVRAALPCTWHDNGEDDMESLTSVVADLLKDIDEQIRTEQKSRYVRASVLKRLRAAYARTVVERDTTGEDA